MKTLTATALRLPLLVLATAAAATAATAAGDPWVQSGLTASTLDVTRMIRTAVDTRLIENMVQERTDGGAVWLDLTGTHAEVDNLGATAGHENDIWAVHLGADIRKGDSFFGVVYTYAYSEGESRDNPVKHESEGDFFSIQVFGQQAFGNFAISANGGWMHSHGEGRVEQDSTIIHSNTWTADIAAKVRFDLAGFQFVPYVKVETTYIDTTENNSGTRIDDILLHRFPVGFNVSRSFEAGAWHLRPSLDLAVIRTAGDTEIDVDYQGVKTTGVVWTDEHTLWRSQLGLRAAYENFRLGLNYEYIGAKDGRADHTLDLQAEYVF